MIYSMLQFNDAFSQAKLSGLHHDEAERFVMRIAEQSGLSYVNLQGYTINPEALVMVPEATAQKYAVVCFDLGQNLLKIAAQTPSDPGVQQLIQQLIARNFQIELFICSHASLEHAWKRYKDVVISTAEKKGVLEIDPKDIERLMQHIKALPDVASTLASITTINNSRRISETLELIFAGAIALHASDIHIEPEEGAVRVRYRFDGVLHDVADIDSYIYKRVITRLKLLSGMTLNTKKIAQDGRFTFTAGTREVEIRSSIIPGAIDESIVMRILDPGVASFSMEKLQLNKTIAAVIKEQIKKPNGLIFTTGPTGSGKTTALYAFLREAHNDGVKIITIENPVEYKLEGIVQTQTDKEYTFASGLRAILRQDPDIIMIGEVRDQEVAETAIHAAQTGHLVFTTLHTNSAAAGFARLIDLGIDPRMFGTSINIMLGQRLVRILCSTCKVSYQASATETAIIQSVLDHHPHPPVFSEPCSLYRPVGCTACGNTGYKGRAGIFEGIIVDQAVEEAIIRDPREHVILEAARPQGIPTMLEDGIEKVLLGTTSMAELARVIELPNEHELSSPQDTKKPAGEADFLSHVV